jgi:hypothetical protein
MDYEVYERENICSSVLICADWEGDGIGIPS